jgi:hypothetical protein
MLFVFHHVAVCLRYLLLLQHGNGSLLFVEVFVKVVFRIRHADPRSGPTYMAKIDLAHGFYRLWLAARSIPSLGVVFPTYDDKEPLVAFPLTLPMGWVESPPYFCTATGTVADLANAVPTQRNLPLHPLEHLVDTPPPPIELPNTSSNHLIGHWPLPEPVTHSSLAPFWAPVLFHDIYVDDYMSLAQGTPRRRTQHWRTLLHSLDEIFRPKDAQDPPQRKDVPSLKKFRQGDACYATRKVLLGWIADATLGVLTLPAHRYARLLAIFDELRGLCRVSLTKWYKVLGELRSMTLALPGGHGLFSLLQSGLKDRDKHRIRITPAIQAQLADFEHLARDLGSRPTRLSEIVPDLPVALGASDAAKPGMGGVWFPATTHSRLQPIEPRFPLMFSNRLVIRNDNTKDTCCTLPLYDSSTVNTNCSEEIQV